jgi:hypothetical protein
LSVGVSDVSLGLLQFGLAEFHNMRGVRSLPKGGGSSPGVR